ncbi:MAG: hypothetical protein Q9161_008678 [Pseudevernia consocians]
MHRRKQKKKAAIPKPLSRRPKKYRDLSLPRNTKPQSQGGGDLLAKLPYEIRRMIYVYVLGDEIIHLDRPGGKSRLAHYRCERRINDGGYHSHRESPSTEKDARHGKMSLAKTCRAIYNEATDTLYTTNTFSVQTCPNLQTFIWFSQSIRRSRLASITAVYINMPAECFAPFWTAIGPGSRFWDFIRDWGRMWETMATRMSGLRFLRVQLRRTAPELGLGVGEDWIRPMLRVRGLSRFELVVEGNGVYREWSAGYCEQLRELQEFLGRTLCSERQVGEEYPEASTCWKRKRPCKDGICCKKEVI